MNNLPVCLCGNPFKRYDENQQIECYQCKQLYFDFQYEAAK